MVMSNPAPRRGQRRGDPTTMHELRQQPKHQNHNSLIPILSLIKIINWKTRIWGYESV